MARRAAKESSKAARPATTPEGRENQLIALAIDLAEKQIRAGTASSQVISHFLKLATTREQLEKEKLQGENQLLLAKIESLASQKRIEDLYQNALNAMRSYAGLEPLAEDEDDDDR